jgi:diguanylate cyclase (GGDEF)-like protein/PAS domain S-box-containing protein
VAVLQRFSKLGLLGRGGLALACGAVRALQRLTDKLSALEGAFVRLYEDVPFGSHTLDADGMYLQVNSLELSWLGYRRDEIVAKKRLTDFLTPASQALLVEQNAFPGPHKWSFNLELELLRRDGSHMPIALRSKGFFDAHGKLLRHRGAMFDLRESRQILARQMAAVASHESLAAICITDSEQIIQHVNRAFTAITGYSAQEAIGQKPHFLSSGHHDKAFYQAMWASVRESGRWQGEIWNRRKNGSVMIEWLSITAVVNAAGNITNYVGSFYDITSGNAADAELRQLSLFDPLTGLPNRRLLLDRLARAMASAKRHALYGAILYVNLDNFNTVKDTHGHEAGNLVLVETARRLHNAVREMNSVSCLCGDEFVVLLEGLDAQHGAAVAQTSQLAEEIVDSLSLPFHFGALEFHCSVSVGIELFLSTSTVLDVLQHAHLAMYHSKAEGRNRQCLYDARMQTQVMDRAALETDLRRALELQQFRLFFQPQVNLQGQIVAAEALLRWLHPLRGLVSPGEFITVAEESGLIIPIGHWVLQTACVQIKAWEGNALTRHLRLAVNISALQYKQGNFVGTVQQVLGDSAINPAQLVLEVTESMMLDVSDAISKMNTLKELQVRFSMDDFGTGYSSLASLSKLPLSELKIDQSFVRNLGVNTGDAIIVQATIAMGIALGMEVVAEGVETRSQHETLIKQGCKQFQGYLFSRPVPIEEFEALLQ